MTKIQISDTKLTPTQPPQSTPQPWTFFLTRHYLEPRRRVGATLHEQFLQYRRRRLYDARSVLGGTGIAL